MGYFIGDGIKESQPWHYLNNPSSILGGLELPEKLSVAFKDVSRGGNDAKFRIKLNENVYEVHASSLKRDDYRLGLAELSLKKINSSDF